MIQINKNKSAWGPLRKYRYVPSVARFNAGAQASQQNNEVAMKRACAGILTVVALLLICGCTLVAPSYKPDYSVLDSLKRQKLSKIAVEPVSPKDPDAAVNKISLRGINRLESPSKSFAQYLEDAIISDFTAANMLDQKSSLRLTILLVKNDLDISDFSYGHGTIQAQFGVDRDGTAVFTKRITEQTRFQSSFVGAIAIPMAQNEYPNLVRALLKALYNDQEFIDVLKKQ